MLSAASSFGQFKWSELDFHYQTGSVPPPYYHEYDFYITSDGKAQLIFRSTYTPDSNNILKYNFNIADSSMLKLNDTIEASKIMTEEIESYPEAKRKIGGPLQNVTLTLNSDPAFDRKPIRIEVTFYPSNEQQRIGLGNLYVFIVLLIPQDVMDDVKTKIAK
jgi:hypothetical protein